MGQSGPTNGSKTGQNHQIPEMSSKQGANTGEMGERHSSIVAMKI